MLQERAQEVLWEGSACGKSHSTETSSKEEEATAATSRGTRGSKRSKVVEEVDSNEEEDDVELEDSNKQEDYVEEVSKEEVTSRKRSSVAVVEEVMENSSLGLLL